ncbi:MAG: hypothetical protein ACXWQE_11440, partial [Bdellovibrionales bacterium]
MMSIRFRLFFLFTLFAGTTLTVAYFAYDGFMTFREQRHQLDLSYTIRDEIQDISTLRAGTERLRKLQGFRAKLTPERRMEEFSNLIQAISEGNPRLLAERHKVFMKNETEFQRFERDDLDFLEKRLMYY